MTVHYVIAIDPGVATGVAIGRRSIYDPLEVIFTGIVPGGTVGFCEWLYMTNDGKTIIEQDCAKEFPDEFGNLDWHTEVVCETFKPRGGSFAPSMESLRIEGVVIDHFGSIVKWQTPADKTLVKDEFLKEHGLWLTGKDVGHEDGRDANDALLHLFIHALRSRHIPTLEEYWGKK